MINTRLIAHKDEFSSAIYLKTVGGAGCVKFDHDALFYIVTGFRTVEAYNAHHEEKPTTFLVWKREH